MATTLIIVPAGTTSANFPLLQGQSLCVGPSVQGGTVQLQVANTQSGPYAATAAASSSAFSYRPSVNQWVNVVAATQSAVVYVSDMLPSGTIISAQSPVDSPNSTSEVILFSFRIPPNVLPANFRCEMAGRLSVTNNANVKTLTCRMNGIAGTSFFTSPSLASNADYNFTAGFAGIGDAATLKGFGSGATGGLGLSTTAYTTLSQTYIASETEIVITATKATGTDTMKLDSLTVTLS